MEYRLNAHLGFIERERKILVKDTSCCCCDCCDSFYYSDKSQNKIFKLFFNKLNILPIQLNVFRGDKAQKTETRCC